MYRSILSLLFCLCTIGSRAQVNLDAVNKEYSRVEKIIASDIGKLRRGDCPECNYLINIKLHFDGNGILKEVVLSKSTPEVLDYIVPKLKASNINWRLLLEGSKAVGSKIVILPVSFICESKEGKYILTSGNDIFELNTFKDNTKLQDCNSEGCRFLNGIYIKSISPLVKTEEPAIKAP